MRSFVVSDLFLTSNDKTNGLVVKFKPSHMHMAWFLREWRKGMNVSAS